MRAPLIDGYEPAGTRFTASVGSTTVVGVRISHPDRLIYPDLGMSKIEFARYFESNR